MRAEDKPDGLGATQASRWGQRGSPGRALHRLEGQGGSGRRAHHGPVSAVGGWGTVRVQGDVTVAASLFLSTAKLNRAGENVKFGQIEFEF